jgi:hypothetical protein
MDIGRAAGTGSTDTACDIPQCAVPAEHSETILRSPAVGHPGIAAHSGRHSQPERRVQQAKSISMKHLYILSSPLAGSTLLSLVLGQHPLVANLGEVSFIPKLLALQELCTCGAPLGECETWRGVFDRIKQLADIDMRSSPYAYHLGDAVKTGPGLIDYRHQTPWFVFKAKLRAALDTAVLITPWQPIGQNLVLPSINEGVRNTVELYRVTAEVWGKSITVDASKFPRKGIRTYLHAPDRVRILHLVRDGRGVITSRKRYNSIEEAARKWKHHNVITARYMRRWVTPEHRMTLRYEDFVSMPEASLRKLCAWLEIPYSEQMLELSGAVAHSAGGNISRFSISQGIKSKDERWRSVLSAEELRTFERIAGKLNRYFGYV